MRPGWRRSPAAPSRCRSRAAAPPTRGSFPRSRRPAPRPAPGPRATSLWSVSQSGHELHPLCPAADRRCHPVQDGHVDRERHGADSGQLHRRHRPVRAELVMVSVRVRVGLLGRTSRETGAAAIITVLLMSVVLIGLASIVVELGLARDTRRQAQNAADAAALAAGNALTSGGTDDNGDRGRQEPGGQRTSARQPPTGRRARTPAGSATTRPVTPRASRSARARRRRRSGCWCPSGRS